MISIILTSNSAEVIARLDQVPAKIRKALIDKMNAVMDDAYNEYHGALPNFEIEHGVDEIGDMVVGYMEPTEPKSIAREFGGKGYYDILPTKAKILRFIAQSGDVVYAPRVRHPPSLEFRDIRFIMGRVQTKLKDSLEGLLKDV